MTELSFAKSFLSTLDARPIKLQPDHISPAQTLEITNSYTLPRMPTPMQKRDAASFVSKAAPTTVTISLKSSRNPVLGLTLPDTDLGTSVLDLKERVAKELKMENTQKVRLLYNKKPCSDSKTVKEVVGDEIPSSDVEFGVMVMGYTASNVQEGTSAAGTAKVESEEKTESPVAQGPSGQEVLGGEEFWTDLRGFLVQRIRDEGKAGEVFDAFKGSWK